MIFRSIDKILSITIDPQDRDHLLRLHVGSAFLSREKNLGKFSYETKVSGKGNRRVLIERGDFKSESGKELEWDKISTFSVSMFEEKNRKTLRLTDPANHSILKRIELIDLP